MPCLHQILIRNKRYNGADDATLFWYGQTYFNDTKPKDLYIWVPCGHCKYCIKKKQKEWTLRLLTEMSSHKQNAFLTLTYKDEFLNDASTDDIIRSVRQFLDNVRKRCGKSVKHFIVSELGNETERFHWHGILFGTDRKSFPYNDILQSWKYGRVSLGYCNIKTARYVVKYISKQFGKQKTDPKLNRVRCSAGIGLSYITPYNIMRHRRNFIFNACINGSYFPLPTYYKNRIFDIDDKIYLVNNPFEVDNTVYNGHKFLSERQANEFRLNEKFNDEIYNQWLFTRFPNLRPLKSKERVLTWRPPDGFPQPSVQQSLFTQRR